MLEEEELQKHLKVFGFKYATDVSQKSVKEKFNELSLKWHPDKQKNLSNQDVDVFNKKMLEIKESKDFFDKALQSEPQKFAFLEDVEVSKKNFNNYHSPLSRVTKEGDIAEFSNKIRTKMTLEWKIDNSLQERLVDFLVIGNDNQKNAEKIFPGYSEQYISHIQSGLEKIFNDPEMSSSLLKAREFASQNSLIKSESDFETNTPEFLNNYLSNLLLEKQGKKIEEVFQSYHSNPIFKPNPNTKNPKEAAKIKLQAFIETVENNDPIIKNADDAERIKNGLGKLLMEVAKTSQEEHGKGFLGKMKGFAGTSSETAKAANKLLQNLDRDPVDLKNPQSSKDLALELRLKAAEEEASSKGTRSPRPYGDVD